METVITGNTRGGAEPTARLFGLEMNERDFNNMMIRFAAIYGFRIAGMMLREQTGCGAALTADAPAALPGRPAVGIRMPACARPRRNGARLYWFQSFPGKEGRVP